MFSSQQPRHTRMFSAQTARCFPWRVPHTPQHPMCQRHRTFRVYRSKLGRISAGTPVSRQSLPTTAFMYGVGIEGCGRASV